MERHCGNPRHPGGSVFHRGLLAVFCCVLVWCAALPGSGRASAASAGRDAMRMAQFASLWKDEEPAAAGACNSKYCDLDGLVPRGQLGVFVSAGTGGVVKTTFRIFSPRAYSVELLLARRKGILRRLDPDECEHHELVPSDDGTWSVVIDRDLRGYCYAYRIDGPRGRGECFDPANVLSDPWARANVGADGPSVVVDTSAYRWMHDSHPHPLREDLVIYEMHVRDYTAHPSSGVPEPMRGRYLGLLQGSGTGKVLGNLEELGVNAVELLPVCEFDNRAASSGVNHWGYMTSHFMAPESYYASAPGQAAVDEFKAMVDGLHDRGIKVIMDVVFNHTAEGNEQGPVYNFKGFDNRIFYRLTPDFYYWNGTGCGNEFRTEHPAVRKYVVDALKVWVHEYKIDGFRFDLAASIDRATLDTIEKELPRDVYLIAEPWTADWNRRKWDKGTLRGTRWSNWNDDFRNNVRAFVSGGSFKRDDLITVIAGTCFWWTSVPGESVNYVECHDNATLADFLNHDEQRNKLAAVVLFSSQGIPMLHEGQEFGKDKKGNDNSYDQDNDVNYIDWTLKKRNRGLFDFYKALIAIRRSRPVFRFSTPLDESSVRWIRPGNERALGYELRKGDDRVMVLLNGSADEWVRFELPPGRWRVLCDGERADPDGLRTARRDYGVPPLHGVILEKDSSAE